MHGNTTRRVATDDSVCTGRHGLSGTGSAAQANVTGALPTRTDAATRGRRRHAVRVSRAFCTAFGATGCDERPAGGRRNRPRGAHAFSRTAAPPAQLYGRPAAPNTGRATKTHSRSGASEASGRHRLDGERRIAAQSSQCGTANLISTRSHRPNSWRHKRADSRKPSSVSTTALPC